MEEQTETFVGPRLGQEIQPKNPVERIRRPTDRLFILIFTIIVILWLGIGIAALCASPDQERAQELSQVKLYINAPFSRFRGGHIIAFVVLLVLSVGSILFTLFLTKKCTKFFVYLAIGIFIISAISACYDLFFESTVEHYVDSKFTSSPSMKTALVYFSYASRAWIFLKAIFMIASVISVFKVNVNDICHEVKDFCGLILVSPLMILLTGFVTILGCIILLFTANAIFSDLTSNRNELLILFDILILVIGCIFALSFVYNFILMVISQYTVNYYWNEDDKPAIGPTISQILRYHIGTIMFSSMPCIPFICGIVQAFKHTRSSRNKESCVFYIASKVYLVANVEYFALIVSSIYGFGLIRSLKKTFDIVLRRCYFFLAVSGVIEALITIMGTIVLILTGIALTVPAALGLFNQDKTDDLDASDIESYTAMYMAAFLYGCMIPLITFAMFLYFAAKALLINKIIIYNKKADVML